MILVPTPKKDENGKARMIQLLQSGSVVQLASYHRFVAYEEIATARIDKRTPLHAELALHGGRTLSLKETWTGESLDKESSLRLLERLLAYEPDTAPALRSLSRSRSACSQARAPTKSVSAVPRCTVGSTASARG